MARFSQAISEGDGISLVFALAGDVESLARAADEGGAEALAVDSVAEIEPTRAGSALPVLLRRPLGSREEVAAAERAGAAALVLDATTRAGDELEALYGEIVSVGLDCAVQVVDDEDLARVLERIDPDIVAVRDAGTLGGAAFERTLDVLPDVPAGKLVICEGRRVVREQIVALERAGVDAVVVGMEPGSDLAAALVELAGEP